MFPGGSHYGNEFQPERGRLHAWYVWNEKGAVDVLRLREFDAPGIRLPYTISFANGAAARLVRGDAIWKELADIAVRHPVAVFTLSLMSGGYVPWTGDETSPLAFDAIRIGEADPGEARDVAPEPQMEDA